MLRPFDLAAAQAGAKVRTVQGDAVCGKYGDELQFIDAGSVWVFAKDSAGSLYSFKPAELRITSRTVTNYVLLYRRTECPMTIEQLTNAYSQYFTATAFDTEGAARAWAFDRQVEIIRIIPVEVEL